MPEGRFRPDPDSMEPAPDLTQDDAVCPQFRLRSSNVPKSTVLTGGGRRHRRNPAGNEPACDCSGHRVVRQADGYRQKSAAAQNASSRMMGTCASFRVTTKLLESLVMFLPCSRCMLQRTAGKQANGSGNAPMAIQIRMVPRSRSSLCKALTWESTRSLE